MIRLASVILRRPGAKLPRIGFGGYLVKPVKAPALSAVAQELETLGHRAALDSARHRYRQLVRGFVKFRRFCSRWPESLVAARISSTTD